MITETAYSPNDLKSGVCKCCREMSSEIVKEEGMCVDCVEEIKFMEACYETEIIYERDNEKS
jgi:hypothetical protein